MIYNGTMKFRLEGKIIFEAEDIVDALKVLADKFNNDYEEIENDKDNPNKDYLGTDYKIRPIK